MAFEVILAGNHLGRPPQTSLPAASSALNTVGTALDNVTAVPQHSLFVVATGTTVTGGVVTLQGSNDGVNWFNTACTVTTNAVGAFAAALSNFPFRYVRAAITTGITGTGTPSVTAYVASTA